MDIRLLPERVIRSEIPDLGGVDLTELGRRDDVDLRAALAWVVGQVGVPRVCASGSSSTSQRLDD